MSIEKAQGVIEAITSGLGEQIVAQSSVMDGLAKQLEGRRWKTVLEIGTLRGLSASVLACFAETVITVDVQRNPDLDRVLEVLGRDIRDRIATVVVPDNDAKVLLVRNLNFDFAYIDGGHTVGQVQIDHAITRRCGEMLFHDYPASGSGCNGVGLVLDECIAKGDGIVEISEPFARWRAQ